MSITQYKDHPLSELLPLMEGSELEELATDIRQNTQRAPITLYEGKISLTNRLVCYTRFCEATK